MSGHAPSLSKNVVASLIANIWMAAISLLLVPIYIQILGIEAYGLIGVFTTLTALVTLFDFGLTTTLTRETARIASDTEARERARSLVRTLEIVYWSIAVLIALILFLLIPLLSTRWLNTVELSPQTVRQALVLICCVIVAQWPFSFYSGGLLGLQRQVLLSAVQGVSATIRAAGVIVVLTFLSPTIQAFLVWQLVVSAASTLIVMGLLWRYLPKGQPSSFDRSHLKRISAFALGITGVSILSLASTQTDKIVLSKVLTLQQFGYYALAGVVASSIYMLVNPLYSALFPRFTQLVATGDSTESTRFYHLASQTLSLAILPVGLVLAIFSREILQVWTSSVETASQASPIVSLLVISALCYGLQHVPWAVQLSHAWTRLGFWKNLISVIILVPLAIGMGTKFGAVGVAGSVSLIKAGELVLSQQVMHRRVLIGELRRWYVDDVLRPGVPALLVAVCARVLVPFGGERVISALTLLVIVFLAYAFSLLFTPDLRARALSAFRLLRLRSTGLKST